MSPNQLTTDLQMPRRAAKITQADAARSIRAAKQAGASHVEIKPDGTILVHLSPLIPADVPADDEKVVPL
jgi:hypothetical protein